MAITPPNDAFVRGLLAVARRPRPQDAAGAAQWDEASWLISEYEAHTGLPLHKKVLRAKRIIRFAERSLAYREKYGSPPAQDVPST